MREEEGSREVNIQYFSKLIVVLDGVAGKLLEPALQGAAVQAVHAVICQREEVNHGHLSDEPVRQRLRV